MSKVIKSTIKRWPGTVTIADPMTMPQVLAVEKALIDSRDFIEERKDGKTYLKAKTMPGSIDAPRLEAVIACVESWDLKDFQSDPIQCTPRDDSRDLISLLFSEILNIYNGEIEIPNE